MQEQETYNEEEATPGVIEDEEEQPAARRLLLPWLALVLGVVIVVAALGLTGWWWVSKVKPAADSPEVDFARDMSVHHSQAVDMAVRLRERTTNMELRYLTLDIMLTQQAQIGQMQGWLAAWQYPLSGTKPGMAAHGQMIGMATLEQINGLDTLPVAEAEVAFLQLMIRHHQGGVGMARQVLTQTDQPEVVRLADSIVKGQQSEILYMQDLLRQRGVSTK